MIPTIDEMQEEYYTFLNDLRESGLINMNGATPYLMKQFPELDYQEAVKWLVRWKESFKEQHFSN